MNRPTYIVIFEDQAVFYALGKFGVVLTKAIKSGCFITKNAAKM